jgi:hypothetical protein
MNEIIKKYLLPALVEMKAEKVFHLAAGRKVINIFYY